MSAEHDSLIAVGRITGTHGIKGQLRLQSYSGNLDSLTAARSVILRRPDGTLHEYGLRRAADHGTAFLLTLARFDNINQVLDLVGSELCLQPEQLPATGEGEYYWRDLLGLTVSTDSGQTLGTISDILETGANDIYVVSGQGREYLIPAVASVISKVDLPARTMIITPLEGLLDL
jgi:16S rRNA processing protein RimM